MKLPKLVLSGLLAVAASLQAQPYTDATADTIATPMLDIQSVNVSNDATSLFFTVNLGDNDSFYSSGFTRLMLGFNTTTGGTDTANAWGSGATMLGMDFFAGGSSAGMNLYSKALGGWPEWQNSNNNTWVAYSPLTNASGLNFSLPLSSLGLNGGDTFTFDVYTAFSDTGRAIDAAGKSTSTQIDWNLVDYNSGSNVLSYTVAAIPEPSTYAAIIGSLALGFVAWRRRKQSHA